MFSRLAKVIALVAAVQLLGGHWMVLQAVAWAGMVVTYSQGSTLISAVEKTFDGKHPCSRCHAVQEGQTKEKQSSVQKVQLKWDAVLPVAVVAFQRMPEQVEFAVEDRTAQERAEAPRLLPPLA